MGPDDESDQPGGADGESAQRADDVNRLSRVISANLRFGGPCRFQGRSLPDTSHRVQGHGNEHEAEGQEAKDSQDPDGDDASTPHSTGGDGAVWAARNGSSRIGGITPRGVDVSRLISSPGLSERFHLAALEGG